MNPVQTKRRAAVALLVLAGCLCSALVGSCNDETPPPAPARFNRPNRVDFVCVDTKREQPEATRPPPSLLPRAECAKADPLNPDPKKRRFYELHALVTQAGRGEVAVVNLTTHVVLDSRRDIPGYTFVPIGEMPTAIIAPPEHPDLTYVADFGSRDVRVLSTLSLVATVEGSPQVQVVRLSIDGGQPLLAPTDMVLAPDESALFVAVPDAGRVLRLPLLRCDGQSDCTDGLIDEAGITSVELREPGVPAPPTAREPSVYEELCGFDRDAYEPAEPTPIALDPKALDAAPRPSALAVDSFCQADTVCPPQRLLVADVAQPVIHVLDLDAWAAGSTAPLLAPLITGVPTSDVVITPRVPRSLDDSVEETQYVYAVDAHDGSVLALEDGQVLNVNTTPGQRADRLAFSARNGAAALEVITPGFEVHGKAAQYVPDDECTDDHHEEQDPARLRGVFLTAALTDGTVHVVDVHDMELRADVDGGSKAACRACPETPIPLVVRNQERVALSFVPTGQEPAPSFVPVVRNLAFYVDGVQFGVRADGSSSSRRAPGLACIACDGDLTHAFPISDEPAKPDMDAGAAGGRDAGAEGGVEAGSKPAEPAKDPTDEKPADDSTGDGFELLDAGPDGGVEEDPLAALDVSCPAETPSLLCVGDDPWSSGEDDWQASYEGVLPATVASHGHFEPATVDVDGEPKPNKDNITGGLELVTTNGSDLCRAGVLGEDDIADDYAGCDEVPDPPAGDQLVLSTRPLGRARLKQLGRGDDKLLERCAELVHELDADKLLHIAFEIRRAFTDRLVVYTTLVRPIGKATDFADIEQCLDDDIAFDVRSLQAFTVRSGETGFQHHVRANAVNRCQVDPGGDALARGRARLGCGFRNHSLQFRLPSANASITAAQRLGVDLVVGYTSRAAKMVLRATELGFGAATVVPVQLKYGSVNNQLYLVDISDRGLLPIPLDPFPAALSSSGQFN